MAPYGDHRDENSKRRRGEEQPDFKRDVISEAREPSAHGVVPEGPGNRIRQDHGLCELPDQVTHDVT